MINMMQYEVDLREKNRNLISQLIERQKIAKRASRSSASLHRQLDSLQQKLDSLEMGGGGGSGGGRNRGGTIRVLNESSSLTDANTNNNNMCQLASPQSVSPRRDLINDFTSASPPLKLTETARPPPSLNIQELERSERGDRVEVKHGSSPEESRVVRRKLADEMLSLKSPLRKSNSSDERTTLKHTAEISTTENTTPRKSHRHSSRRDTPKSILKHRRMIDNNVKVESKFCHTPGWMDRAKHTRLRKKSPKAPANTKKNSRKLPTTQTTELSGLKAVSFTSDPNDLPADLSSLRSDEGNQRNAARSFESARECQPSPGSRGDDTINSDSMPTPQSLSQVRPSPALTANTRATNMLGCDWIAAVLDHSDESQITEKQEAYFRELKEFRRLHRDECQNDATTLPADKEHMSYVNPSDISGPRPDPPSPSHTCIHGYTVNERLYAEPIHSDLAGQSRCAVCNKKKQVAPTAASPSFVRVSIPRCTLSSPYKIKPHRRKSFDPSDSVALSKHCLAGWVHPHPTKLPLGKNVDLANETNRLKSKFTMTLAEAEDLARRSKSAPIKSRDLAQTTLYNKEVKKITNQLLDMSNAMNYQSQLFRKTSIR